MVWMRRQSIRPCSLVGSSSNAPVASRFPIDRAERLEGFRCIRFHRHQVVSVVDFDDAAGQLLRYSNADQFVNERSYRIQRLINYINDIYSFYRIDLSRVWNRFPE